MSTAAAEIKVTGLVQGVGFRHFCYQTAIDLKLTGYARNEPDRSVFIIVEGHKNQIESFIKSLSVGPSFSNVQDVNVRWIDYSGQYDWFKIER